MKEKESRIAYLYADIMDILEIEEDENNVKTPERVARMLLEVFENVRKDPMKELLPQISTFPAVNHARVTIKDIPITSFCSHHHLPFMGKARISYIPDKTIVGLSKIPRVVEWFSKKPQLQEYLTNEIGEFLVEVLEPQELEVCLYNCTHTCMMCRGVKSEGTTDTHFEYRTIETNDKCTTHIECNINNSKLLNELFKRGNDENA